MNSDPALYLTLTAVLGLAGFSALILGSRCDKPTRTWWTLVILGAVTARLVSMVAIAPSDDLNRYLWEGKIVASGRSPYTTPASDPMWNKDHDTWWDGMNHRTETTVYPPLTQLIGAVAVSIHESPVIFKSLALIGDLGIAFVLLFGWGRSGLSQRWIAALWLLNPVPVISFAGEGHFDAWMILFSISALAAAQRARWHWSWALLGTAIAIKWLALVMLPLWLWRSRGRGSWAILPILVFPAIPFWETLPQLAQGLLHFGSTFGSNNPLHYTLTAITHSRSISSFLCASILGGWTLIVILHSNRNHRSSTSISASKGPASDDRPHLAKPTAALWSGLLLFLPTVTYWYAAWLLPFVAITRSKPWWIFSLTSVFYYAAAWHAQKAGEWHHPAWAVALTWLPLYLTLLLRLKRKSPTPASKLRGCDAESRELQ